ncbi:hypothetical protein AB0B01_30755, partial [Streptomyces sp. NPDC044571]|uniref:hypothetical protein n=1 Tax=Streptomyces sp. NPDC044571 TaxID=3155371 RepID=UPI0033EBB482
MLAYYGPPSRLADIVECTERLRRIGEDAGGADNVLGEDPEEYDELACSWRRDWLPISLGIGRQACDGLFLVCRPGPDFGRVGRYFDEDSPSFTEWLGLRHTLADFAEALEQGGAFGHRIPLAFEGVLVWDGEKSVIPDPVSPLALAATASEPERSPVLPQQGVAASDGGHFVWTRSGSTPPPRPLDEPDLLFVEGLDPAELLRRLGAVSGTVRPRSREQAERSGAAPWAAYRPMVRAGVAGGWAYAVQEAGAPQFERAEVLHRVSAGSRAVALSKGRSPITLTVYEDGRMRPEASRRLRVPLDASGHVVGPAARPLGGLLPGAPPRSDPSVPSVGLLAEVCETYGIPYQREVEAEAELTSALLLPVLEDLRVRGPQRAVTSVRDFDLATLVERTPADRLRTAVTAQLVRLAD